MYNHFSVPELKKINQSIKQENQQGKVETLHQIGSLVAWIQPEMRGMEKQRHKVLSLV